MSGKYWTPYDIELMIHHHCSGAPFERSDAPIYHERFTALMDAGLLEYVDGIPRSTALGAALVGMWCAQPIPVVEFVDPRLAAL